MTEFINMSWNGVFMAEIQKHECLYNKFSREYRNRELRNECWQKVAEKFDMTPMAAEKKFRNIRTAYGRWLRKRRSNPVRNEHDFIPYAFENCEWLGVHIIHRDSTLSNDAICTQTVDSDEDGSPVTMSNIEFLNFGDYGDSVSPSYHSNDRDNSQLETTPTVETKDTVQPQEATETQTTNLNGVVDKTTLTSYNDRNSSTQSRATEIEISSTRSLRDYPGEQITKKTAMVPHHLKRKYYEIEDEDELYCRSLVPRLKRLTPQAKAYVRIQLEQLLYHAEYSGETPRIGMPFGFRSNEATQPTSTSFLNGRAVEQSHPGLSRD